MSPCAAAAYARMRSAQMAMAPAMTQMAAPANEVAPSVPMGTMRAPLPLAPAAQAAAPVADEVTPAVPMGTIRAPLPSTPVAPMPIEEPVAAAAPASAAEAAIAAPAAASAEAAAAADMAAAQAAAAVPPGPGATGGNSLRPPANILGRAPIVYQSRVKSRSAPAPRMTLNVQPASHLAAFDRAPRRQPPPPQPAPSASTRNRRRNLDPF
jgi:hypothetical protein